MSLQNTTNDEATTFQAADRACRYCGRAVAQQAGRGRPREYCLQGDCQARAKRDRELRRAVPGLEGALARAEDLYERMQQGLTAALTPLAEALEAELSPRGVEARLSAVHAQTQAQVAKVLAPATWLTVDEVRAALTMSVR